MPQNNNSKNESWAIQSVQINAYQNPPISLNKELAKKLWNQLADTDPAKAVEAMWTWVGAGPEGLQFLRPYLLKRFNDDEVKKNIQQWIKQLDADKWATRREATKKLTAMGSKATPYLQAALKATSSAEVKIRIQEILAKNSSVSQAHLRYIRAQRLLKLIGTKEALNLCNKAKSNHAATKKSTSQKKTRNQNQAKANRK